MMHNVPELHIDHENTGDETMTERRRLFRWMLAGSAGLTLNPSRLVAEAGARDEPWLRFAASRKHRAFLDIRSFMLDGYAFKKAATLRNTLMSSFDARADEIGIAFGAGSNGLGHVLGPDLWEEYRIGDKLAHAARPEELAGLKAHRAAGTQMAAGVAEMKANGVRVLACRNTIGKWSRDLAAATGETPDAVQAKILKGLSPGVEPVPAMIVAAVLAQARELSYVAIG
jgi:hypothetical protein